jgi:hypothetical protein
MENALDVRSVEAGEYDFDTAPAFTEIEKARATAYIHIARMSSITGLPKGVPFSCHGSDSVVRGYASFLKDYLGMTETSDNEAADIILSDGNTIACLKSEVLDFSGIEISLPTIGYIDVVPKTHIGAAGGLFLVEQILNGLSY